MLGFLLHKSTSYFPSVMAVLLITALPPGML